MDLPQQAIEQPAHAAAPADAPRSHLREDGTLVLDILIDPPCGEASTREIVVCAPGETVQRYDPPDPPPHEPLKAEVELSENAKVSVRGQPGREGAVEAVVNLTIAF